MTPICVVSTSVSAILQTPWNTAWGLLQSWHSVPVLFQNPAWQAQTDMAEEERRKKQKEEVNQKGSLWLTPCIFLLLRRVSQ